jgi:hypothetical protein
VAIPSLGVVRRRLSGIVGACRVDNVETGPDPLKVSTLFTSTVTNVESRAGRASLSTLFTPMRP